MTGIWSVRIFRKKKERRNFNFSAGSFSLLILLKLSWSKSFNTVKKWAAFREDTSFDIHFCRAWLMFSLHNPSSDTFILAFSYSGNVWLNKNTIKLCTFSKATAIRLSGLPDKKALFLDIRKPLKDMKKLNLSLNIYIQHKNWENFHDAYMFDT